METLRPILREDAVAVVLGLLLSAAGTAGLVVAALRKRFRDLLLIAFGSFALLYGVRLLADTRVVPLLFDVDADIWRNIVFVVTSSYPSPDCSSFRNCLMFVHFAEHCTSWFEFRQRFLFLKSYCTSADMPGRP